MNGELFQIGYRSRQYRRIKMLLSLLFLIRVEALKNYGYMYVFIIIFPFQLNVQLKLCIHFGATFVFESFELSKNSCYRFISPHISYFQISNTYSITNCQSVVYIFK